MKGKFRKAIRADLYSIYKLVNAAAKSHRVLSRSKQELEEVIGSFFVYETDGKIIGCCALEIYNKKIGEIRSLVVVDRYRKQSIGRLLLKACIDKAKKAKKQCGFDTCLNDQYAMFIRPNLLKS